MIKEDKINILMVGSSTKVKGGMTTVVESFVQHNFNINNMKLKYIPTHIDKGILVQLVFFTIRLIEILFCLIFKNIDIVHMHMSERGSFKRKYLIYKLAKMFNKKVITHTHGAEFEEFFKKSNPKLKSQIKELLRESDIVITLGNKWDNIIKEIEPQAYTIVLRNAVKIPEINNDINDKNIKVLFLAVLIKRKGITDLIEAAQEIIEEVQSNKKQIEFIIAGEGELKDSAKSLVKELGLSPYFNFVGWVNGEDKIKLLQETDIFVLPSYNEGLPLSILEAISYGIPIISTNVGSIDEAVKNEKNGYLVNPGDKVALSQAFIKLISSGEIKSMGLESRNISKKHFNIDVYFENIINIYRKLVNKN
ncbi:glycosyltransferase family 4 protein [Niallia sp. Man26]|uniref:glycosyltransferase family 4 protein n=1 Tax=Niallia sp. Man26 TaxID=2912824 RepID=UPI002059ECD1|nr:glycosyltransferase family 4 protein [Niallia sp. Man26]UPO87339.1 glycosyltransferase family 4 protein [Niallia sp. Man26]